jgi:hypothetical protein
MSHIFLHGGKDSYGAAAGGEDGDQGIDVHLLCVMEGRRRKDGCIYVACVHAKTEGRQGNHGCSFSHQMSNF